MIDDLPPCIFSQLIRDSIDSVLIIDSHGQICYANQAFESLCGYSAVDLVGTSINGLLPEAVGRHHDHYLQSYTEESRASTVLGNVREMQIRHKRGEIIPVELKAVDLGIVDGCRYFGGFIVDLRIRKSLEAQNDDLLAQLHQLALTDVLTGLPNRRAFDSAAARLFALAQREKFELCIGIADLDRFKAINDLYGHFVGDQALKVVAVVLQENLRAGDFVGRIGGEEFGFLFPSVTLEGAAAIAERLRQAVESSPIAVNDSWLPVTISIGMAQVRAYDTFEEAMARADRALYQAKEHGRNRVETAVLFPGGQLAPTDGGRS